MEAVLKLFSSLTVKQHEFVQTDYPSSISMFPCVNEIESKESHPKRSSGIVLYSVTPCTIRCFWRGTVLVTGVLLFLMSHEIFLWSILLEAYMTDETWCVTSKLYIWWQSHLIHKLMHDHQCVSMQPQGYWGQKLGTVRSYQLFPFLALRFSACSLHVNLRVCPIRMHAQYMYNNTAN